MVTFSLPLAGYGPIGTKLSIMGHIMALAGPAHILAAQYRAGSGSAKGDATRFNSYAALRTNFRAMAWQDALGHCPEVGP